MRSGVVEPIEMTDMVTDLRGLAGRLDPDGIADHDVPQVLTDLGCAARLIEGMVTIMARRSTEIRSTHRHANRDAAADLARATGTSPARARRMLGTSQRLKNQPEVAAAVRGGRLSGEQTEAVTDAVAADPTAALDLLDAAASQSVPDLKRTCRDTRHAADPDPDATRRRHHVNRSCRTWSESDGEWRAFLSGPADVGARFAAALRGDHDDVFRAAHAAGQREPDAAYRLDALLAVMERGAAVVDPAPPAADRTAADRAPAADDAPAANVTPAAEGAPAAAGQAPATDEASAATAADDPAGHGAQRTTRRTTATDDALGQVAIRRRSGRQTKVIVLVDAEALRRGMVADGETCMIAGVGPVSLSAVKRLIPDAHIAYVLRDARQTSVAHLGRQASAHQRTALEARGYECAVPTCRSTHLLEIDHVCDWAFSRQTVLDDLDWLCPHHHELKSRKGHRLTGPPGRRRWETDLGHVLSAPPDTIPRDHPDHPEHPTTSDHASPRAYHFRGKAIVLDVPPACEVTATCRTRHRALRRAGWRTIGPLQAPLLPAVRVGDGPDR